MVALLDFTIQLFYADTIKLFLTLYGHKLPSPSIDISSDSTLLVSGSDDKTVKIWGMDFGNIQKSWHAHDLGVTQVGPMTFKYHRCMQRIQREIYSMYYDFREL